MYIKPHAKLISQCVTQKMISVPDNGPAEAKAICGLVNNGMNPQLLFKASYTFYKHHLESQLALSKELRVLSGLFEGMLLYPASLASALLPKALGTYEKEVQDYLQESAYHFDKFLDVGCAEGFYLSAIARWKKIPCLGIDIDTRSQESVTYAANVNGVSSLVSFASNLSGAKDFLSGSMLCLVDVDGSEVDILEQLNVMLEASSLLTSVKLIIESDQSTLGRQNTPELIALLCASGWRVERTINQDPGNRFVGFCSELSFLEQVVRGAEGRPGGQCWIVAEKSFSDR